MVVGFSASKLMNSIFTHSIGTAICISRSVLKCCSRNESSLNYFIEDLRQKWIGQFGQSSRSEVDIGGGERVTSLDLFSLVGVDS